MKAFHFSLDNVLSFREQVLDNLRTEHGQILADIAKKEQHIRELEENFRDMGLELDDKKRSGTTIAEVRNYEMRLFYLQNEIRAEQNSLAVLRIREQKKKQEVIEAKQGKASIEELKEKSRKEYNRTVQKAEEQAIEEFVSTTRAASACR